MDQASNGYWTRLAPQHHLLLLLLVIFYSAWAATGGWKSAKEAEFLTCVALFPRTAVTSSGKGSLAAGLGRRWYDELSPSAVEAKVRDGKWMLWLGFQPQNSSKAPVWWLLVANFKTARLQVWQGYSLGGNKPPLLGRVSPRCGTAMWRNSNFSPHTSHLPSDFNAPKVLYMVKFQSAYTRQGRWRRSSPRVLWRCSSKVITRGNFGTMIRQQGDGSKRVGSGSSRQDSGEPPVKTPMVLQ